MRDNYVTLEKVENGYTVSMDVLDEKIKACDKFFPRTKHVTYICENLEEAFSRIKDHFGEK